MVNCSSFAFANGKKVIVKRNGNDFSGIKLVSVLEMVRISSFRRKLRWAWINECLIIKMYLKFQIIAYKTYLFFWMMNSNCSFFWFWKINNAYSGASFILFDWVLILFYFFLLLELSSFVFWMLILLLLLSNLNAIVKWSLLSSHEIQFILCSLFQRSFL